TEVSDSVRGLRRRRTLAGAAATAAPFGVAAGVRVLDRWKRRAGDDAVSRCCGPTGGDIERNVRADRAALGVGNGRGIGVRPVAGVLVDDPPHGTRSRARS